MFPGWRVLRLICVRLAAHALGRQRGVLRRREVSSHGSARADPAVQSELGARIAELVF